MKKILIQGMLTASLFFVSIASAKTLHGRVVNVADGDTITVLSPSNQQSRVRLLHIDAPENGQAFGRVAQKALASKISQQHVQVKYKEKDRYGRILGEVFLNGENVNLWMVQKGYAWPYFRYKPPHNYLAAYHVARQFNYGLWQDTDPIQPEIFRHKVRR